MGFGLRFREKVKQVGKKHATQPDKYGFVPTTYERTELTYDEAVRFAESLKVIRKRIAEANLARTKMFRDVESTLTGGLPCIHEIDPVTGEHTTSEAAPEGAANYVHTGTLTRMSEENDVKIQHQVFDPIDKWISEVDLFKGKMKILENLRLELDGSRRDHISIENKIAKAEQKHSEVDAKHTTHIQSKDASVAGKRTAFEQYEAQLYEELQTIIGETGVLHTALDRTLRLEIDAYQKALDPIASTTQRLEQLGTASGSSQGTPASSVAGYGAGTGFTGGTSEKHGYTGGQSGYGGQAGGQSGYGGQAGGQSGYGGQAGGQSGYGGQAGGQSGYGGQAGGQSEYGGQAPAYATSTQSGGGGHSNMPNAPTHSAEQSSVVHPPSAPPSGIGYEKPYAA